MITDDEIDALPEDDDDAFVQYESILRDAVFRKNGNRDVRREYVAHILAFLDTRELLPDL